MQSAFKRYEKKYLITCEQSAAVQQVIKEHMSLDRYGEYSVSNLYYDTENWSVIRASIEKPAFKEKLRLRYYGAITDIVTDTSKLYLELKKKYRGVVYKRRIELAAAAYDGSNIRTIVSDTPSQIARELSFYLQSNAVTERVYLAYQRTAFSGKKDAGLRITFDSDVRFRLDDLNLNCTKAGQRLIPSDNMLMEIKTLGGMPMWLARALSEVCVFPTTFSKVGMCYIEHVLNADNNSNNNSGDSNSRGSKHNKSDDNNISESNNNNSNSSLKSSDSYRVANNNDSISAHAHENSERRVKTCA